MRIYLVADSGGHLTELLQLKETFEGHEQIIVSFNDPLVEGLPNTRLISSATWPGIISLIILTWKFLFMFLKEKPDVIVSTGSHIAIPAFYLGKLLFGAKLIFIECSAQVYTPSTTGKIVYHFTDLFLVQWEELLKKYGNKAKYVGGLI